MTNPKIRTAIFDAPADEELEAMEKELRARGIPPFHIFATPEYYDGLCKAMGSNLTGAEFKNLIAELYAANEETMSMNLKNLTSEQLYKHLLDETGELRDRAAELKSLVLRGRTAHLIDALDGVGATLRRVTALRDEMVARGMIK